MEFINYAHRGASAYAPENTLASFYLGCQMGANGVETDVQRTKDGALVLFHDNDLMRIAGRPEAIQDLTYQELLKIDFGEHMGERFRGEKFRRWRSFCSISAARNCISQSRSRKEALKKKRFG